VSDPSRSVEALVAELAALRGELTVKDERIDALLVRVGKLTAPDKPAAA
jgi:hypothetical protein